MSGVQLAPIDAAPGYKRVADAIEKEILAGRLAPGALLPTEHDLARQLGVNRSTVREGIRSLENAGLLRRAGGKRLVVCVPQDRDIAWNTSRALGLGRVTFQELWELQMNLEPFAAALAALRRPEDILEALDENIEETETSLDDDKALVRLDLEFHRLVAVGTENRALVLSVKPIGLLLFSATTDLYRLVPQARRRLLDAHRRIADAIRAADEKEASSWMEKHIRDFKRGYDIAGIRADAPIDFDPTALRSDWEASRTADFG